MGLYERIKEIASSKGYSINKLEKELGFARSSISKFNKNMPSMEKIKQIATLLGVSTDLFFSDGGTITCGYCGLSYDSSYAPDVEEHKKIHHAWSLAVDKFGDLYCDYSENERLKSESRDVTSNPSASLEERSEAELKLLRCLFSRSLMSNNFDLRHVTFEKYVAMMLKNKTYGPKLNSDLYKYLVEQYGTLPGIAIGTTYHIPKDSYQTIAAHLDISDLTTEEQDDVLDYIEFIRNKRKNRG